MKNKKTKHTSSSEERFKAFKPYDDIISNSAVPSLKKPFELEKNNLINFEPELIRDPLTGSEKWELETDSNFSFSREGKAYHEKIAYSSNFVIIWQWIRAHWLLLAFIFVSLIPLFSSSYLLAKITGQGITGWFIGMLKSALESKVFLNISVFNWIFIILVFFQIMNFALQAIASIPHLIRETQANNRAQAKSNILKRAQAERASLIKDINSRLDDLKARQLAIQKARDILENQIFEDGENRLVLNKRLGSENVPLSNEALGGMILQCLSDTYFRKVKPLPKIETNKESDEQNESNE